MNSKLLFVLVVWYMKMQGSSQQLLDYQNKCNVTPPEENQTQPECDYRKYLECEAANGGQGYCNCKTVTVPGEGEGAVNTTYNLHYLREVSTCVSPPGGPCWRRFYDGNFELPCAKNAECIQSNLAIAGYCECRDSFSHKPETDECVLGYQDSCTTTEDCDRYSHLVCAEQKCTCGVDSEWNTKQSPPTCVGLVGGRCDDSPQRPKGCTENAVCGADEKICSCNANYQAGSDLHCYKTYNQPCTMTDVPNTECHPNFECRRETPESETAYCLCPDNHDFSEADGERRCLGRSGETCQLHHNNPEISFCTPFSTCNNVTGDQNPLRCECDMGYSENQEKFCRANHGTECVVEPTDNSTTASLCNDNLKLTCVIQPNETTRGVCECKPNHRYDTNLGKCLGEAGQQCENGDECMTKYCDGSQCGCPAGSSPNSDGTLCLLSFGGSCNTQDSTAICDPAKLLGCSDAGTCNCSNVQEFIKEDQKDGCSVRAGSSCSESNRGDRCVTWSQCAPDSSGNNVCQCIPGYAENTDGHCAVKSSAGGTYSLSLCSIAFVALFAAFLN